MCKMTGTYLKETPMFRRHVLSLATLACLTAPLAFAQGKDIKIAHIYSKTGPLEAYGKQTRPA